MWIEVEVAPGLISLFAAFGLRWMDWDVRPGGRVKVWVDNEVDALLEEAVGTLAGIRWRYEKGRELQLELPGLAGAGAG